MFVILAGVKLKLLERELVVVANNCNNSELMLYIPHFLLDMKICNLAIYRCMQMQTINNHKLWYKMRKPLFIFPIRTKIVPRYCSSHI